MSRIKGSYKLRQGSVVERWLDPVTGYVYETESEGTRMLISFVRGSDGSWTADDKSYIYVFKPEVVPADWYVLRMVPDERRSLPPHLQDLPPIFTAFGPFTEAQARADAAQRSEMSAGKNRTAQPKPYAVVQVQAGNTVVVQPPTPPAAVAHWS